jgi:hypothetical protein
MRGHYCCIRKSREWCINMIGLCLGVQMKLNVVAETCSIFGDFVRYYVGSQIRNAC